MRTRVKNPKKLLLLSDRRRRRVAAAARWLLPLIMGTPLAARSRGGAVNAEILGCAEP
jgi:hypothetical protein